MNVGRINRRTATAPKFAGRAPGASGFAQEARAALSALTSEVMLSAADAVEAACPIRTGHLLSNFILATGTPHTGVEGSPESVSYSAQDTGRAKVLEYDAKRDGKIYLTNHVDYLKYQRPFVTEAMVSAASAAPRGKNIRARSALRSMARAAFKRGA